VLTAAQQELRAAISADPAPERWGEAALNLMPFEPVVDGEVLPAPPLERIAAGAGAGIDLLIGTNSDEFRLFLVPTGVAGFVTEAVLHGAAARYGLDADADIAVYRAQCPDATPGELLAAIATDWFYRIPAIRLAEAHAARPGGTHLYEFAWQPPTFEGRLGACHAAELPFVFDNLHDPAFADLLGVEPPQELADTMHAAWISFATSGRPGWPGYETRRRTTMRFDAVSEILVDPRSEQRALWDGRR
jgi:para-nitrobenzyl esterase